MSWQFLWKILLEDVKPDSILEKKNYHLLLMIFLQALLMKPRRPVNQNKQILVKKISPIWHWFYIFQQNLSKKLLRQMLVRTEKGRTFIKWRTSRKNVHVIILYIYLNILFYTWFGPWSWPLVIVACLVEETLESTIDKPILKLLVWLISYFSIVLMIVSENVKYYY